MKILGRGWQYTAYDLGNGRVLKRYNSALVAYWVMLDSYFKYGGPKPWHIPLSHRVCKDEATASLSLVAAGRLDPWMTGSASVREGLSYEQDKVRPLQEILQKADEPQAKEIIDKFVRLNDEMLKRDVIDKSFKIGVNFGIDSEERVILMDIGELYTGERLRQQRLKRVWDSPYIHRTITNPQACAYYLRQMDDHFGFSPSKE